MDVSLLFLFCCFGSFVLDRAVGITYDRMPRGYLLYVAINRYLL
jgi:hypothetical protein